MKKLFELIRNKDREEKPQVIAKKSNNKEEKQQQSSEPMDLSSQPPSDLFWDDYSDVGYC